MKLSYSVKKQILITLICVLVSLIFGMYIGYRLENTGSTISAEYQDVPIIETRKELNKVLKEHAHDYVNTKVILTGKLKTLLPVAYNTKKKKPYIMVRERLYDKDGKIESEKTNLSYCGVMLGSTFNLHSIIFMNSELYEESYETVYTRRTVEVVKNHQEGTLVAYIRLGEIQKGTFYSGMSVDEVIHTDKNTIEESAKGFYVVWLIFVLIIVVIPSIIKIIKLTRKKGNEIK